MIAVVVPEILSPPLEIVGSSSFEQRNQSETHYFQKSNFAALSKECVGITSLRDRLSQLLFGHVKQELPKLRKDLEEALTDSQLQLGAMGNRRAMPQECKAFMAQLSLDFYEIGKAAINGHYEGEYTKIIRDNTQTAGCHPRHELSILYPLTLGKFEAGGKASMTGSIAPNTDLEFPIRLSKKMALNWVRQVLIRTRDKELPGNFNPLLVGELFWEQSSKWQQMAEDHVEDVADVCSQFLEVLLLEKCPKDVYTRLWSSKIEDALKQRSEDSAREMQSLMEDIKSYPITYNHYYTDTVKKRRRGREQMSLTDCIANATIHVKLPDCNSSHTSAQVDAGRAAQEYCEEIDPDMENHSCGEALDSLHSIYKLSQKTFIDNVTTQVVERHVVRGLEKIFSPIVVNGLSDTDTQAIASEPLSEKRQRDLFEDKIRKLKDGRNILRGVMRSAAP